MLFPTRRLRLPSFEAFTLPAVGATAFIVYLATLAPGLTWANNGADGGDLIAAAATGGVAHPSGYPTYLILARVFLALPAGSLAWRTNLLSALCAALAAATVARLVSQSAAAPRRFAVAGGGLAGLAFALSPVLWSQAVITEVYALHSLFVGLILLGLPLGRRPAARPGDPRLDYLAGAVFGLALGNHLTTALLLPPWLFFSARADGRWQPQKLLRRLGALAGGLLVYVYLPLSASRHPAVNWGLPVDWAGFWWVVSGAPYRALAFGLPTGLVLNRIQGWASLIIAQFGLPGMVIAVYGLFFGKTTHARVTDILVWVVAGFSIFAIGYNTADSYAYLLPAFLALAVWLGLGITTALASLEPYRARRPARLAVVAGLLLALGFSAVARWPAVDASHDLSAEAFGLALMRQAPPNSLIFTHADKDTFSAWYYHLALAQRPDVTIIVEPLLEFDWYRINLAASEPRLVVPAQPAPTWRQAILDANARLGCDATYVTGQSALSCPGSS